MKFKLFNNKNGTDLKLMNKNNLVKICSIIIFTIMLSSFFISTNYVQAGFRKVHGFVEDANNNGIQSCKVEIYMNGFYQGYDNTNASGYYTYDLGYIMSNTIVTLKFYPVHNFKDKVTTTMVTRTTDARKDVTLKQFMAILVGGGNDSRFSNDAQGIHEVLVNHYSFDDDGDNIYQLTFNSRTNTDRNATMTDFEWAIDQVAANSTSIDEVIIWITTHGYQNGSLVLGDDLLSGDDLDDELDEITCSKMYIFLGQCFSGKTIEYINDTSNRAIYTSCNSTQTGWADGSHSFWPWATYRALDSGTGEYENAEEADDNSDNMVSLFELYDWAYDYIVERTNYEQIPQRWIGSSIDPDTNDYIGDEVYP
ncbi:MAG: C13 family peptidase [Candidatus Heimdallarchaeota archaeon]